MYNRKEISMSSATGSLRTIYETGLRNQHAVENQAIELLERQVERLENYPEMASRMRDHINESKEQASRLEELLAALDTSHSAVKDTMMSIVGNLAALMHAPAPDEVIKNTFANYAFEHYEIAAYKSLLTLAELTGDEPAAAILHQSLREEEAMAHWIDTHIVDTTRTFAALSQAGETAGI
jgi:ferritin-like metal-binding protein YciE